MENSEEKYCSLLSAAANEPLIGSAGKTGYFFLLEYNGTWEDKAFEKSDIPIEVKQRLSGFSKSLPDSKVLMIKHGSPLRQGKHFFVVIADDLDPRLYRIELKSYQDLLDLDLADLVNSSKRYSGAQQSGSLYLVCTNGRRDRCCARFSIPVFQALKDQAGDTAWECSHIGGHRFGPNFFHFPYGLLYGRVRLQEIETFFERLQSGQVVLENLRGRTPYPGPVQAAEHALRQQTGELSIMAYRLLEGVELQPGFWQTRFIENRTGQEYKLNVQVMKSEAKVFESCLFDKQTELIKYVVSDFASP